LTLQCRDVDFDNLLVTVFGKGRKERRVPFSFELRKMLFRYACVGVQQCARTELMFPSRQGSSWDQRNSLRGLHLLQRKLGLPTFGWHRLRHTFATNYLRQGGDIRVALDGARAFADHHDTALPAPADGGPEREPPEAVDSESAGMKVSGCSCFLYPFNFQVLEFGRE
jgi:integrase